MINVENKENNVEILISTMHKTSLDFLSKMFPNDNYVNYSILIINQTSSNKLLTSNYSNIRVINSFEKGLSRSRNLAINNAKLDLCLFADDDVSYEENLNEIIVEAFSKNNLADIITFQLVNSKGELYTNYPDIIKHNKKTVTYVNSVVIAFKRNEVIKKNALFNVYFGIGTTFETGGEYVFLRSALRKGLKIFFEPKVLLEHPDFSSGKAITDDKIVYARTAIFYKYNGVLTYLKLGWYLFLLIKHNKLKINQFFKKYKQGLKGIDKYKSLLKKGVETRES